LRKGEPVKILVFLISQIRKERRITAGKAVRNTFVKLRVLEENQLRFFVEE